MHPLKVHIQETLDKWAQEAEDSLTRLWEEPEGYLHIQVITAKQAKVIQRLLGEDPSSKIHNSSDPSNPPQYGFRILKGEGASLYTSSTRHKLTTDIDTADGAMRCLAERNGSALVQCWDGTLGWIDATEITSEGSIEEWTALKVPAVEKALLSEREALISRIIETARSYIGLPYVLGGRSNKRMDCSGLTSRVMRNEANCVLPRHSTDQRRCGERVTKATMEMGDLLFARLGNTNVPHVGVVSRDASGEFTVIHASQRANAVIEESLEDFFTGYRFMGVRRFVPHDSAGDNQ